MWSRCILSPGNSYMYLHQESEGTQSEGTQTPGEGTYKYPAVWNHLSPNLELRESGGVLPRMERFCLLLFILTDRVLLLQDFTHNQCVTECWSTLSPWILGRPELLMPGPVSTEGLVKALRGLQPPPPASANDPKGKEVLALCLPPWWLLALVSWLSKAFLLPHAWMGAVSFHWSVKHCSSSSW